MSKNSQDRFGTAVMISQGAHSLSDRDGRTKNMSALARVREYYDLLSVGGPASGFVHLSAALIVGDQKFELRTEDDVSSVYERLLEKYRSEGIREVTFDETELSVFQVHPWFVLIKTIAIRRSANETLVKRWACSYLVRQLDGSWKFDLVTAVPN